MGKKKGKKSEQEATGDPKKQELSEQSSKHLTSKQNPPVKGETQKLGKAEYDEQKEHTKQEASPKKPASGVSQQQGQFPTQRDLSRGPPPGVSQQQEQPPTQGAWSRGPPPGVSQQQGQFPTQGAWSRGPPPGVSQQQGQPPTQKALSRGPPPGVSQQQEQPPTQGAWSRGPPPGVSQQQGQFPTQGAWSRGPPPGVSQQQGQPPTQKALSRGPPPGGSQQQEQSPTQGAWSKGPPGVSQQQGQTPVLKDKDRNIKSAKSQRTGVAKDSGKKISSPKEELQISESSFQFAKRIYAPNKSGRPIVVATNFFPLTILDPSIVVYHYDVTIEPDRPKDLLRTVWKKFVSLNFPTRLTAFDGKNAYSNGPLMKEDSFSGTVKIQNDSKEKEFFVTAKEVRKISLTCFLDYRRKMVQDPSMKILPEAEISVLEIILKEWASDNYVKGGRSFFLPSRISSKCAKLSDKLALRFGFYQSACLGYKLYLNFDLSHKAFYLDRPLIDIINCFRHPRTKIINIEGLDHFLRTVKVEYRLPNDPVIKTFRVNKLMDNALVQSFSIDENVTMTVAKYFETEKRCKLKHPDLPLLWVGSRQKSIYLPMEFCRIAPDQVYRGIIDPFETKEMVKQSTSDTKCRKEKVYSLFDYIKFNEHSLMKEFGLQVSNDMEKVTGRILDPPRLRTSRSIQVNKGVWRIADFLMPVALKKWCILNLDKQVRKDNIILLQNMLKAKGNEMKMEILDPIKAPIDSDSSIAGLKKAFSQLKDMEMVLVIISEDKSVYSRVKVVSETQEGVLTQCVRGRTVSQDPHKLTSTIQNILLKINAKLGGRNHCLDRDSVPECLKGKVMVIGADVTHSSPGMKIPSVAAVTVSYDPAAFQYSSSTQIQPKGEVIRNLKEIISVHLKKFYDIRKDYPERIIFYRDGVSEGELEIVFKKELSGLKDACSPYCTPKITFVVVQKRHHTRFFPVRKEDEEGKNFNVPVGTCVDTDIVHPRDLDFYLVSHASLLGTARPTRYRVIYDDNKLTDDELEKLSFYLCHLFPRCNRSVSYPSPTYNAHLAAARVRAYMEGLNLTGDQDVESIQKKLPDRISRTSPMFYV